jgi:hypothetical protein
MFSSGLTVSAAAWRAADPSIRAARSVAAGGWEARPDKDSVQPTAHQFPSIPRQAGTVRWNDLLYFFRCKGLNNRAKTRVVNTLYYIPLKLDQMCKLQAIQLKT